VASSIRQSILDISREIVAETGPGSLTFEAVARRLGKTKQAVIYWFPTKQDLLRELVAPWIEAEADEVIKAVGAAGGAREAIDRAVRALVAFHLDDLDRFRLHYLAIQLDAKPQLLFRKETLQKHVHPVTGRMYAAIEHAIEMDDNWPGEKMNPRQVAVAVHTAALGLVLMVGLGKAVDDPLAHATEDLVETLARLLAR
jgi:AcrR family transcriptional regulator